MTEDTLIGEWYCKNTVNLGKSYDGNGKIMIANDSIFLPDHSLSSAREEGRVMETKNGQQSYLIKFQKKTVFDFIPMGVNEESYSDIEYVYVSNDNFKLISNAIWRYKNRRKIN